MVEGFSDFGFAEEAFALFLRGDSEGNRFESDEVASRVLGFEQGMSPAVEWLQELKLADFAYFGHHCGVLPTRNEPINSSIVLRSRSFSKVLS